MKSLTKRRAARKRKASRPTLATEAAATPSSADSFLFCRAPLPSDQLKALQDWIFSQNLSIRQVALRMKISYSVIQLALKPGSLSWRSRRKIAEFLGTLLAPKAEA